MQESIACPRCETLRDDVEELTRQLRLSRSKYEVLSDDHVALMRKYQFLASLLGINSDLSDRARRLPTESPSSSIDFSQVLIIDIGSYQTKAGFSSSPEPQLVFDTVFDRVYPIERGRSDDVGIYERIFDRIFEELRSPTVTDSDGVDPKLCPLLICEVMMFPYPIKEKIVELLFTKYEVPAVCFTPHGVLNMFAHGILTGVSVELGEGLSQVVPVYQGYGLGHAMARLPVAGVDVHDLFSGVVEKSRSCFGFFSGERTSRAKRLGFDKIHTVLEGFSCLMEEHLDIPNLPQTVTQCIQKCSLDLRRELWGDILISGGCSKLPGMKERLTAELMKLAPSPRMVKVRSLPQKYSVFSGAVCFSGMSSFRDEVFTMTDFRTEGPSGIHKRRRLKLEQIEITDDEE